MFDRFRAKKEIEKRIKPIGSSTQRLNYLNRLLKKSGLLSPTTREAIYSKMGDLYETEASEAEDVKYMREPMIKAIEAYTQAGEIHKARSLLNKIYLVNNSVLSNSIIPWHLEAFGDLIDEGKAKRLEYEIEREDKRKKGKKGIRSVERYLPPTTTIIGFIGAIFFFSSNLTGNAIANLSNPVSNIFGAIFFLVGILGTFLYFKGKTKKKSYSGKKRKIVAHNLKNN